MARTGHFCLPQNIAETCPPVFRNGKQGSWFGFEDISSGPEMEESHEFQDR
jgi:hypothetical protein